MSEHTLWDMERFYARFKDSEPKLRQRVGVLPWHNINKQIANIIGIEVCLCYFTGFNFGFEELEDIDCSLIVETTFGVVELGKGGG